jgi:hypothetical protein
MKKYTLLLLLFIPLTLSGCYHAQITTGLDASNEVYQQAWATSFIGGLVPPDIVNAEEQCSNGVAKVETRHSFLNMIAQMITFSLYSPMEITVTCASANADLNSESNTLELAKNSDETVVKSTFEQAAKAAASSQTPVYVTFK